MAMENKRIIQLSTERLTLSGDDYVMVDSATDGSAKYRLDRLKETDTTLSVSGMAADAAATGQAISAEATARGNAVTAEAEARQAADTTLGNDVEDLKSAMSDAETAIEQLDEKKADINGTYDDMTVGTAENVLSNKYTLESVPYQFRKTGGDVSVGSRLKEKIVGGTVAWNQLCSSNFATTTKNGVTITNNGNGTFTLNGTATATDDFTIGTFNRTEGHKYLFSGCPSGGGASSYWFGVNGLKIDLGNGGIYSATATNSGYIRFDFVSGQIFTNARFVPQIIDLTAMFGAEIADRLYTLEQTTSGSGVALFRKLFPKLYYPYNPGELLSVSGLVSHDEVGFNQWDEDFLAWFTLEEYPNNSGSKNYIPVLPNTTYHFTTGVYSIRSSGLRVAYYDSDKNLISYLVSYTENVTTPSNCAYMKFGVQAQIYGDVYNHDICINLSDPSRNGEYEPYVKHSYPLDSSLTLRGVPKLVDNKIKFDGDVYESTGKVTRRYGVVDLGTLDYAYNGSPVTGVYQYYVTLSNKAYGTHNIVCPKFIAGNDSSAGFMYGRSNSAVVSFNTTETTAGSFKTAMSGVYLVYELATSTTEEAQPFVNPQICDKYGTEEYVSTSIVPVGHETEYFEDVVAKVDGLPWDLSMIAPIDNGTTATRAYTTGQYFLHNDQFCKAKTDIASGATFTLNTNYEVTTVAAELYTALH